MIGCLQVTSRLLCEVDEPQGVSPGLETLKILGGVRGDPGAALGVGLSWLGVSGLSTPPAPLRTNERRPPYPCGLEDARATVVYGHGRGIPGSPAQ